MTVSTDLDAWWAAASVPLSANDARIKFGRYMNNIDTMLDDLAQMHAAGAFDDLPLSWRNKAIWAWQQLDAARDAIKADAEFMEGITWRP